MASGHAVVRAEGRSQEVLEQYLEKKRIQRRAVLETPHFMSLPFILARTDLLATVPHAIGFAYVSEHASITLVEPPLPLPRFDLRQHWHRKFHNDPRGELAARRRRRTLQRRAWTSGQSKHTLRRREGPSTRTATQNMEQWPHSLNPRAPFSVDARSRRSDG